jgi:hypothetical protein
VQSLLSGKRHSNLGLYKIIEALVVVSTVKSLFLVKDPDLYMQRSITEKGKQRS